MLTGRKRTLIVIGCTAVLVAAGFRLWRAHLNALLLRAIWRNNRADVARLLRLGADPETHDSEGMRAIDLAARETDGATVDVLVRSGASAVKKNRDGYAPMHYAMETKNLSTIMALVRAGGDPNYHEPWSEDTPLRLAAQARDTGAVSELLRLGADARRFGADPLDIAVSNQDEQIVRMLLAAGARDQRGLLDASANRSLTCARLLLAAGASVNAAPSDGGPPVLQAAVVARNTRLARMLLEHGADPNMQQPAHLAARRFAAGPTVWTANPEAGYTALMFAADLGDMPVAQLLLRHGASAALRDASGHTAAYHAQRSGHRELARLLERFAHASISGRPGQGR